MYLLRNITLFVCCHLFLMAGAQTTGRAHAAAVSLFEDLPIDDPAKNSVLQPGEDPGRKINSNILVTAVLSQKHCFLGEPILLTYTLYSCLQSSSRIDRLPTLQGFSTELVPLHSESVTRKKQNGKNYRVFTVQQLQLTPLQEGPLQIDPISVVNEVKYTGADGRELTYSGAVTSEALAVKVDALPVAGRPAGFSGSVGKFGIRISADTVQAAGESNRLQIEISGTGNFKSIAAPEVYWPPGCQHFASDQVSVVMDQGVFPPAGTMSTHVTFVPSKEGQLMVQPLRIDFFNPQTAKYESAFSKPLAVQVLPALVKPKSAAVATQSKPFPLVYEILGWGGFAFVVVFVLFILRKKIKQENIN